MTIAIILKARESEGGGAIVTLTPDISVADAVAILSEKRIGAAPVIVDERVVGVFSERDVIHCLAADGAVALSRPVSTAMSAPAITVVPGEPVIGALSLMTKRRIRHLPVVEGDRLVGIVSIGDLVKYRIERIEADAAAMRDYIQSV